MIGNAASYYSNAVKRPVLNIKEKDRFYLESKFVTRFIGKEPEWGPVGKFTFKRTYARPISEDNTATEEFWQTLARIVNGIYTVQKWHCRHHNLPWSDSKAQRSAQTMFQLMWDFKFLPGGRGLWMMGTDYVEQHGSAALNNCSFHSTKDIDTNFAEPFCFLMDFSMLGVGVGSDCRGAGKVTIVKPKQGDDVHVVEDSREGWVELLYRVLEAYVGNGTLPKHVDYSQVRPHGAPIKGFGGTASGPGPLRDMILKISGILERLENKPITAEAIVDICDLIGVCVVAGNTRRSAIIMFGEKTDDDFLNLKNPTLNSEAMKSHRWASNNSVFAAVGMDYEKTSAISAKAGEPGFIWLETAQKFGRTGELVDDQRIMGTNPCGEVSLETAELCNLVETFPSRHSSYEEYERTLKCAYLYAKTVSLIPTHNPKTNMVTLRNRRIGLSQSGIVQSFKRHGRRKHFNWCDQGYAYITKLDRIYSEWLCVRKSIKKTTVKPSGTVSLLPGVTPGIHFEHSEYYFRTVRVASHSPLVEEYRQAGYRVEQDFYDQTGRTSVIYFPVKAQLFDRGKVDVTLWEQMENAAQMQKYWSDNSVSVTVSFRPEEGGDIRRALELYETRLKTVSFNPLDDHGYDQAPYITISADEYKKAVAGISQASFVGIGHDADATPKYCDGDTCVVPSLVRPTNERISP
jgi:adenosylcobalamin-dependent ribonucleoside-triphosphate reductase